MLHVLLVHTQAPQVDSSIEPAIKKKRQRPYLYKGLLRIG